MTSALKAPSGSTSTTVRHTPLTAIESPWPASVVTSGPRMTNRAASARSSLPTTSPNSSTMPVNMPTRLVRVTSRKPADDQPRACRRRRASTRYAAKVQLR